MIRSVWVGAIAAVMLTATPGVAITPPALERAREAASLAPDDPDMQFELAVAYARSRFVAEGWDVVKRIQMLDPGYAARVVRLYEARVAQAPRDPEARFRLAAGYYFQDRKALARRQLERLVAIRPDDTWAHTYLGYLDAEEGNLQSAQSRWKKALELDRENAIAHYLIGQIHYRQGRLRQADRALSEALRFSP